MIVDNNSNFGRFVDQPIWIWDETLRDGEQSPGVALNIEDKVEIARQLDVAGVHIIGAGFPVVSDEEFKAVKKIASLGLLARVGVTVRSKIEDIDCALKTGVREVHIFLPSSRLHLHHKFGLNELDALQMAVKAVEYASRHDLRVTFVAEDSSRADPEYLKQMLKSTYEAGAEIAMVTDTVGVMTPFAMRRFISFLRKSLPSALQLGIHCHNDFGLSTANTLAAVEAGVQYVSATVNGIGERSGNAALEEVVLSLELLYKRKTGIDTKRLIGLSKLVEQKTGMINAPNKAVVGFNAFRHESGVHVKAMIKALETYEPFPPEFVGGQRSFVLGKHSGRNIIHHVLNEFGLAVDDEVVNEILIELKRTDHLIEREKMVEQVKEYYQNYLGISEEQLVALAKSTISEAV
jgi:isopropylmalate/homocitrate/citramalate synthase